MMISLVACFFILNSCPTHRVWDLNSKSCKTVVQHTGPVNSVTISQHGRILVSGSSDKTVR